MLHAVVDWFTQNMVDYAKVLDGFVEVMGTVLDFERVERKPHVVIARVGWIKVGQLFGDLATRLEMLL